MIEAVRDWKSRLLCNVHDKLGYTSIEWHAGKDGRKGQRRRLKLDNLWQHGTST